MRSCRHDAEPFIVDGETVIVDHKMDCFEASRKRKVGSWQAIWAGGVVVHAESRDEAVRLIEDRIKRKKALKQLEEYFLQRRIRKAVDDLIAMSRKPGA